MLRLAIAAALAATTAIFVAGAAWSAQATPSSPRHHHGQTASGPSLPKALAPILANARVATAKYANNLALARKDGYTVTVTQMIPDMGWHFMNPAYTKFDVTKPPILVYEKRGDQWLLGAFEWGCSRRSRPRPDPRSDVRLVRGCMPLQGRHVRVQGHPGGMRTAESAVGRPVRVLASGLRHVAPLGVVPEPPTGCLRDEPAGEAVQQGLVREPARRAPDKGEGVRRPPVQLGQRVAAGKSSCPNAARSTNWPTPGSTASSPASTSTVPRSMTSSGEPVTSVPS